MGFVSNSSSSSFVIGKYFLSEEQLQGFRNFRDELFAKNIGEHYDDTNYNNDDTYVGESWYGNSSKNCFVEEKCYVFGEVYRIRTEFEVLLNKLNIDEDKIHWEDA